MKIWIKPICAVIMALLAVGILYGYGLTPLSIVFALLFLLCPVYVVFQSLRLSKMTEQDINDSVSNLTKKKP